MPEKTRANDSHPIWATAAKVGLTATLVREDGREGDVFSLIGPKRYDPPWKDMGAARLE